MLQVYSRALKFMCLRLSLFLSALLITGLANAGASDAKLNQQLSSPSHHYAKPGASIRLLSNSHVVIANTVISSIDVQLEASDLIDAISVRVQPSEGLEVVNAKDVWELTSRDELRFTLELLAGGEGQHYLNLIVTAPDSEGKVQSRALSISVIAADDIKTVDKNMKKSLAKKALKPSGQLVSGDNGIGSTGAVKVFKAQESSH